MSATPEIKEETVDVEENENEIEQDAAIDLGIPRTARTTPGLNPIATTPLVAVEDRCKLRKGWGLRDRVIRHENEEASERRETSTSVPPPSKTSPTVAAPTAAVGAHVPNGGQSPHSTTAAVAGDGGGGRLASSVPPTPATDPTDLTRQMTKLKRFLSTLLQHSVGLSPVIGDRVRGYIHGLLLDAVGAEQFYSAIQALTNYPMKPFIISFIRTHLHTLQRELECTARLVRLTPAQYLRIHDKMFLDPSGPWTENMQRETANGEFQTETLPFGPHNKRKSADRLYQGRPDYLSPPPPKRMNGLLTPPWTNGGHFGLVGFPNYLLSAGRVPSASLHPVPQAVPQAKSESESSVSNAEQLVSSRRRCYEEEWKRVLLMLGCISDMVEKARRAVGVLQTRYQDLGEPDRIHQPSFYPSSSENSAVVGPGTGGPAGVGVDIGRKTEEFMAKALQQFTEDRVAEVRRKAEEAVLEVKQQAMVQFQKAFVAAETRAVMAGAARYGTLKINTDHRRLGRGSSVTHPSPPSDMASQTCWNCGRHATETCSGCGLARYCGSFCQHKDWESHHKSCSAGRSRAAFADAAAAADGGRHSTSPNAQTSNSDSDAGGPSAESAKSPKSTPGKAEDVETAETASLDGRNGYSLSGSESSRSPQAGHSPREAVRSSSVK